MRISKMSELTGVSGHLDVRSKKRRNRLGVKHACGASEQINAELSIYAGLVVYEAVACYDWA